jgi:uncharacterized protein YkwD
MVKPMRRTGPPLASACRGSLLSTAALLSMLCGTLLSTGASVAFAEPADQTGLVAQAVDLTNGERQKAGLSPLVVSAQLQRSAQTYSQILASGGCFEHSCGPVPNLADRDVQAGYLGWTWLGENLAAGYPTPQAVVAGWMASGAHRDNILSPNFSEIGIGVTSGAGQFGVYWAEEFGARGAPSSTSGTGSDLGSSGAPGSST